MITGSTIRDLSAGVSLAAIDRLYFWKGNLIDRFIHATFNVPTYTEAYQYAAPDGLQPLARGGPLSPSSEALPSVSGSPRRFRPLPHNCPPLVE